MQELKTLSEQQQVINLNDDFKNQLEIMKTEIIAKFDEKVQKMDGKIFQLEKENEKLKIENTKFTKRIETAKQKEKECDFSAKLALTRTNNLEQYTRKDSIRIFGIPDENKDERYDITFNKSQMNLLETIGMDISISDVSIAHRLGTFQPDRPRPIILKFIARRHKI